MNHLMYTYSNVGVNGVTFYLPARLLLLLSEQGTILDRSWRQLREYDFQASQLLPWLNSVEERLGTKMAQPIKSDPAGVKQQLDDLKVLKYCLMCSSHNFEENFWFPFGSKF